MAFRPMACMHPRLGLSWTWPSRRAVIGMMWRLFVLVMTMAGLQAQAAQRVTLLLSEPEGIYQETALALKKELARDSGRWSVRLVSVNEPLAPEESEWIVTLGVRALHHALALPGNSPLLALLVPRNTFEKMSMEMAPAARQRLLAALVLDQPSFRQMQLIRLALPEATRVGVLVGPAVEAHVPDLEKAARESGLVLRTRSVTGEQELFTSLRGLAPEVDVLLLLPDPVVVSGNTLRGLILQTYRQRLPIVAYSTGLAKAGAFLGLYATPAQIGAEAGQWMREMAKSGGQKGEIVRWPKSFVVEVNRHVARSLELRLPSDEELGERLEEQLAKGARR